MASLIQTISSEASKAGIARRTDASRNWFAKRLNAVAHMSSRSVVKDTSLIPMTSPKPGMMAMFMYDAAGKATMEYFDQFPLSVLIGPAPGGFMGLNLHYLEPRVRAVFLDKLMDYATSTKITESTKLSLTYDMLKGASKLKEFAPCIKHYLKSQIRSAIVVVPMTEWEIACFMPTESFFGASSQTVWKDSASKF